MRQSTFYCIASALLALCSTANAGTISYDTDPFAGTPVLTIPGRQVVGGELFVNFRPGVDQFAFDAAAFGMGNSVQFANAPSSLLPSGGVNVIVLQDSDNDNNPLTPFGEANAADLIAARITTPGPGVFLYFNQSLNLPRLVYSADLSSSNADLRVLARVLNLMGDNGRNALDTFQASGFAITNPTSGGTVPEPAGFSMLMGAALIGAGYGLRRRRCQR